MAGGGEKEGFSVDHCFTVFEMFYKTVFLQLNVSRVSLI